MAATYIDPHRLRVAAHELGHYLAWQDAGITPAAIVVEGYGEEAHGHVETGRTRLTTTEQASAYLVGLLAGREAELIWCTKYGLRYHPHTFDTGDGPRFRKLRRHKLVRAITDGEFQSGAQRLVQGHWPRIERLAPRLALRGHL